MLLQAATPAADTMSHPAVMPLCSCLQAALRSSLSHLQWGVMSPTIASATSCTSAIFMQRLPSTPQSLASSDIMPMRYMWSAIVWRITGGGGTGGVGAEWEWCWGRSAAPGELLTPHLLCFLAAAHCI